MCEAGEDYKINGAEALKIIGVQFKCFLYVLNQKKFQKI